MSKKRWIRVISDDGTLATTEILDDEGETVNQVYRVDLHLDASTAKGKGLWQAELYTYMPRMDVLAEARIHSTCPYCGNEEPDVLPQIGAQDE